MVKKSEIREKKQKQLNDKKIYEHIQNVTDTLKTREEWEIYGRMPANYEAFQIKTPVMLSDMDQLDKTNIDITRRERYSTVFVNGEIRCVVPNRETEDYFKNNYCGKIPTGMEEKELYAYMMTEVPDELYMKSGFLPDEIIRDDNGDPVINELGETKVINNRAVKNQIVNEDINACIIAAYVQAQGDHSQKIQAVKDTLGEDILKSTGITKTDHKKRFSDYEIMKSWEAEKNHISTEWLKQLRFYISPGNKNAAEEEMISCCLKIRDDLKKAKPQMKEEYIAGLKTKKPKKEEYTDYIDELTIMENDYIEQSEYITSIRDRKYFKNKKMEDYLIWRVKGILKENIAPNGCFIEVIRSFNSEIKKGMILNPKKACDLKSGIVQIYVKRNDRLRSFVIYLNKPLRDTLQDICPGFLRDIDYKPKEKPEEKIREKQESITHN